MDMFGIIKFHWPQVQSVRFQRAAYVLWGSLAFIAFVFAARGLSGAFHQEMSTLAACCGTMLAAGVSLTALGCYRNFPGYVFLAKRARPSRRFGRAAANAVGDRDFADFVQPGHCLGDGLGDRLDDLRRAVGQTIRQGFGSSDENQAAEAADDGLLVSLPVRTDPDVTQWMTRRMLTDQGECWDAIEGQTAVEFAAGQRNATVHLSICPPMLSVPEIECEVLDHPQIEWKVAAQHPYGMRLEVRRPAPAAEPLTIALGYHMATLIHRDRKAG